MLQETMVRAWRNIDMLDPDPAEVRPWLLTVARRVTIDLFRSRAARPA
jgi:RNA polymerase sigma-70 factor (ECF subfamily)